MFERFTDRSRKIMALANQEAQRFNSEHIGTEHILLGLLKEGSGRGANALKNFGIDLRQVRLEVEKLVKSGYEMVTMGKLPQTPRAKKVLEYSVEEARNLNHNYVGTEHVLLGLVREQDGVAAQVLMNLGVNLDNIRAEVLSMLGAEPTRTGEIPTPVWPTPEDAIWPRKPTWNEYFMLEATAVLSRSPDKSTRHGAVIVNDRNRVVGQGYNAFPSGGDESIYPLTRPEKYAFVIHSERNAILNCTFPPVDCMLYVTGKPCSGCIKDIIQSGIKIVIYGKIGSNMVDEDDWSKTQMMAKNHQVELYEYNEELSPYQWHLHIAEYLKRKGWV